MKNVVRSQARHVFGKFEFEAVAARTFPSTGEIPLARLCSPVSSAFTADEADEPFCTNYDRNRCQKITTTLCRSEEGKAFTLLLSKTQHNFLTTG
jgi:hypothetical protein